MNSASFPMYPLKGSLSLTRKISNCGSNTPDD